MSIQLDIPDIARCASADVVSPDAGCTKWARVRVTLPDGSPGSVELTDEGELWLRPDPAEPGMGERAYAQRKLAALTPALASWRAAELLVEASLAAEAGTLDDFSQRRAHGA